jgi:putative ABC transport system substrate-binding protein
MKGIYTLPRNNGRLLGLLFLIITFAQTLQAADQQIVIVKSSENAYFNRTIETLINHANDRARFKVVNAKNLDSSTAILEKANIIVTLGADSASKMSGRSTAQLIINAYITLEQTEQFQHQDQNHISVLLNQPLERYLAFSHQLLNLKSLGIINRSSLDLNKHQLKILENLDLRLDQNQLDSPNKDLLPTVRHLVRKSEALLMLPNQTIYNRDTLKGILLTTYRSRTPVISYSPGHVKSGALAAIYSSPADIGRHLADLINLDNRGKLDKKNRVIYAEYFSIAINQRVARSLGLTLPSKEKIRQLIDEAAS